MNEQKPTPSIPVRLPTSRENSLENVFWCGAIALLLYEIYVVQVDSILSQAAAILVTIPALIPFYLWCSGRALGLPVFPMFALSFIWTYGLPLVSHHPRIMTYPPSSHLSAGATIAGCLLVGTLIWYRFVSTAPTPPQYYRTLGNRKGDEFFLASLTASVVFNIYNAAGWITLSGVAFSMVRNGALGLTALSTFILCYRFGERVLSRQHSIFLVALIFGFMVTNALSFLLVGSASISLIAISAYTIGRKRVPVLVIALIFSVLTFLNYGKADMRSKYWFSDLQPTVAPWQYLAVYSEWADYSLNYIQQRRNQETEEERGSVTERVSVVQMLLLAQSKSPDPVPFLQGQTYSIIPQILVPRIFNENRIRSQEGTHMLSVHYGLQTAEATQVTTIGWGLVAEAYGNFGVLGCLGLGAVLGTFYGKATRWSIHAPLLSFRSLFSVLLLTFSFQSEWAAGTYLASLTQSTYVLVIIAFVFMENYRVPPVMIPVVYQADSQ